MTRPEPASSLLLGDAEVIVVAYRSRAHLEELLAGLPPDLPLAVVDNSDGADGLSGLVRARPGGRYLSAGGIGFARAANLGARTSQAKTLVFVKPSIRPATAQLATLVADVENDSSCSASAAVLVEPQGRSQFGVGGWEPSIPRALAHALGLHKFLPRAGLFARPEIAVPLQVDWVNGGCMAVRRETFHELGCFDEDFYLFTEDVAFGRSSRSHGFTQRLRTDVPVVGGSGGSGAPSLDMWRLRGASMARYLHKFNSRFRANVMIAALVTGYAARAGARTLLRAPDQAREQWAQAVGLVSQRGFMAGRLVMSPNR